MGYRKLKALVNPLFTSVLLVMVLSFAICLIGALAATNPGSQQLSSLIGAWTCTYKGPGGTQTLSTTGTRLDDAWLQLKGGTGGDTLVTYDAKRRSWVQFRTGLHGNYALLVADGPVSSTTLHWKMVYPENKPAGTTTISVPSASKRIITSEYTHRGKLISGTAVCTKR
jgi:hypothetical protein